MILEATAHDYIRPNGVTHICEAKLTTTVAAATKMRSISVIDTVSQLDGTKKCAIQVC